MNYHIMCNGRYIASKPTAGQAQAFKMQRERAYPHTRYDIVEGVYDQTQARVIRDEEVSEQPVN